MDTKDKIYTFVKDFVASNKYAPDISLVAANAGCTRQNVYHHLDDKSFVEKLLKIHPQFAKYL